MMSVAGLKVVGGGSLRQAVGGAQILTAAGFAVGGLGFRFSD